MVLVRSLRYSLHVIFHPFDGFWDLKEEKRGTAGGAATILLLLTILYILQRQLTGFILNFNELNELNILKEAASVLIPFILWCTSNWCLTTLMDGEGSYKDIFIASAYALTPLILINLPLIMLSNVMTLEESTFYYLLASFSVIWSCYLMFVGTMSVHQYSAPKTIVTMVLIVVGMGIMLFVGLLFFALLQQMMNFAYAVYQEITIRM